MTRRADTGTYYMNTPIHETDVSVELLASAVRTSGGTGTEVQSDYIEQARALMFVLNVSAKSVATSLDVVIQAKVGNLYYNLLRFAQVGDATPIKVVTIKRGIGGATQSEDAAIDPAVSTGWDNNETVEWLNTLRVKWALTATSYTFGVTVYPIR